MQREELGHGCAGAAFDVRVEIQELPAQRLRKQAADGGLAGAHEAHQNDAAQGGWECGLGRRGYGGFGGGHLVSLYFSCEQNESRDLWGRGSVDWVNALF